MGAQKRSRITHVLPPGVQPGGQSGAQGRARRGHRATQCAVAMDDAAWVRDSARRRRALALTMAVIATVSMVAATVAPFLH